MLMKVYSGTRLQEIDALCETCAHARIIRGRRMEEELVICDALFQQAFRITFKVTACTSYVDDRAPSYQELAAKAWILRPASKRQPAGFVRATDLKDAELDALLMEPNDYRSIPPDS
jgi:hypothetical protein